jgi:hypothetical protein
MLERFLGALRCVDVCAIADDTLDELPMAAQIGCARVSGVDVNRPRIRAVLRAVVALSPRPRAPRSAASRRPGNTLRSSP